MQTTTRSSSTAGALIEVACVDLVGGVRAWRLWSKFVDDRDQSSSSSDPGSAIEGFRQKIPLHNKLADLGVKLGDLAIPAHMGIYGSRCSDQNYIVNFLSLLRIQGLSPFA